MDSGALEQKSKEVEEYKEQRAWRIVVLVWDVYFPWYTLPFPILCGDENKASLLGKLGARGFGATHPMSARPRCVP